MAAGNNTEQPDAPLRELQVRILLGSPTSRFRVLSPRRRQGRTSQLKTIKENQRVIPSGKDS